MPPTTKTRPNRHTQTPYARRTKQVKQADDRSIIEDAGKSGLLQSAVQGLSRLISWVVPNALQQFSVPGGSNTILDEPDQGDDRATSRDQASSGNINPGESLLAYDLVPHYLGKTPQLNRVRRDRATDHGSKASQPTIRSFSNAQFKIPDIPSPADREKIERKEVPLTRQERSSVRGKSLKTLEVKDSYQSKDRGIIDSWLVEQDGPSQALPTQPRYPAQSTQVRKTESKPKLSTHSHTKESEHRSIDDSTREPPREGRAKRSLSNMSLDVMSNTSGRSHKGRKAVDPAWHPSSGSGILTAWREICQRREDIQQSHNLALRNDVQNRHGSADPSQWHDGVSFSMPDAEGSVVESMLSGDNPGPDRYWGPLRAFPRPDTAEPQDTNQVQSTEGYGSRPVTSEHRRTHSRQTSLARRPRRTSEAGRRKSTRPRRSSTADNLERRQSETNGSLSQADPKSSQRQKSNQQQATELVPSTSVLHENGRDTQAAGQSQDLLHDKVPEPAIVITKERRKRAGCFSALEEDLEEQFGPYSEVPLKKPKMDDSPFLIRPRVPLLRESEDVLKLREQYKKIDEAKATEVTTATNPVPVANVSQGISAIFPNSAPASDNITKPGLESASKKSDFSFEVLTNPVSAQPDPPAASQIKSITQDTKQGFFGFPSASSQTVNKSDAKPSDTEKTMLTDLGPAKSQAQAPKFSFDIPATKPSSSSLSEDKTQPMQPENSTDAKVADSSAAAVPSSADDASRPKSNTPVFSFTPATAAPPAVASTQPTFSFSSTKTPAISDSTKPSQPFPAFSFTQKPNVTQEDSSTPKAAAAPAFSFGTVGDSVASKIEAAKTTSQSGTSTLTNAFNFGSSVKTPSSVVPSFSFASASNNAAEKPATENNALTTSSTTNAVAAKPAFSFGESMKRTASNEPSESQTASTAAKKPLVSKTNTGFTFGAPGIGASSPFEAPGGFQFGSTNATTTQPAPEAPKASAPVFGFGSANGFSATNKSDAPSTTNVFASPAAQPASLNNNLSAVTNGFSFGQPATVDNASKNNAFTFGSTTNNPIGNATSPAVPSTGFTFGQPVNSFTNTVTSSAPSFNFGAPSSAPFSFGAPAVNNSAAGFGSPQVNTFGQQVNAPMFGANPAQQQSAQPFTFGQTQTAPNSGFASPAIQSPSLQSATAPGSPNAFTFNMGAPGQASGGANGRKIAQPRSRRGRK